ncbi:MAG: hypothetical protein ACT4PL_07075 [Phycisphaerales bacterium]
MHHCHLVLGVITTFALIAPAAHGQEIGEKWPQLPASAKIKAAPAVVPAAPVTKDLVTEATGACIELLLKMQEGTGPSEWPYEGVYRVGGNIPAGYRIGGTSIAALALVDAPGYAGDKARTAAVARAVKFICSGTAHPLMSVKDYDGGYDVRSWGHIYALNLFSVLKQRDLVPADQKEAVEAATRWYLDAVQTLELPRTGGWNYARPAGITTVGQPSPFMTPAALQALFEAKKAGYTINDEIVTRALDALEKARSAAGAFEYAGEVKPRTVDGKQVPGPGDAVPGSVGRMLASECALYLAGRGGMDRVRGALDAFLVHWQWLDKRRTQDGTHIPPYQIAPYYFMFAHQYAAVAIELLPARERAEYRRRVHEQMFSVRLEDGSWDDRVFKRTSNYGTAVALNVLTMPEHPPAATWRPAP